MTLTEVADRTAGTTIAPARSRSRLGDFGRRLIANPLAVIGLVVCLVYAFLGTVGPSLTSHPYDTQNLMATFIRPLDGDHFLGTDNFGRDLYARLAMAIRISLLVGFGVTAISMLVGMVFGTLAGYFRGWVDTVISAVVEFTWGFPLILIAVILTGA
ncbi:MAG: hypothetical protein M3Y37_09540, partial [Chloroflexota bacterium]|nr:hypothetical protein [Chloroflexota bacterium]